MFIYPKREKEGQCVSVDLPGDPLLVVLTWILWTRVCSTCLIPFMLTAQWFPSPSSPVPDVSAASLGHCKLPRVRVCFACLRTTNPLRNRPTCLRWCSIYSGLLVYPPSVIQKQQQGEKKVSVIPSPDQILLFNLRLWTFGMASRSGPGAGGWWAHRDILLSRKVFWSRQTGGSSETLVTCICLHMLLWVTH